MDSNSALPRTTPASVQSGTRSSALTARQRCVLIFSIPRPSVFFGSRIGTEVSCLQCMFIFRARERYANPARSYFWFWRQRNIGKGWWGQWGGRAGLRRKNPFYAQCEWATLLERTIELTRQPVKRLHCRHGHVGSHKGRLHQITNIKSSNFIRVQLCKGLKFFTDKQHHKIRITFEHKLNPQPKVPFGTMGHLEVIKR